MSNDDRYRQCELRRATPTGSQRQVAWIPLRFAVEGKKLRIRQFNDWEDGWEVTACYNVRSVGDLSEERHSRRALKDVLDPHQ